MRSGLPSGGGSVVLVLATCLVIGSVNAWNPSGSGHNTGEACYCMDAGECKSRQGVAAAGMCLTNSGDVCCFQGPYSNQCENEGGRCYNSVAKSGWCSEQTGGEGIDDQCPGSANIKCCPGISDKQTAMDAMNLNPLSFTRPTKRRNYVETVYQQGVDAPATGGLKVLFLHGAGESGIEGERDGRFMTSVGAWTKSYWGTIAEKVKRLIPSAETYFYYSDTQTRGWNDDRLVRAYCSAIEEKKPDVIVTHSMANLLVAYGIQRRLPGCNRIGTGIRHTSWLQSQGPLKGSSSANLLAEICDATAKGKDYIAAKFTNRDWKYSDKFNAMRPTSRLGRLAAWATGRKNIEIPTEVVHLLGTFGGDCDTRAGYKHLPAPLYLSLKPKSCVAKDLMSTAKKYASGSICGVQTSLTGCCETLHRYHSSAKNKVKDALKSWAGLGKSGEGFKTNAAHHAGLHALSKLANWRKESDGTVDRTDGLVGESSCRLPGKDYRPSFRSAYYLLSGDHIDGTFRDAQDGETLDRRPHAWLIYQLRRLWVEKKRAVDK